MLPIVEAIAAHAHKRPASLAVAGGGRQSSYGEFWHLVLRLSAALKAIKSAPRVLIVAPGSAYAFAAMIATFHAGGFYAPLNVRSPIPKQRLVLDRFKPDVIVGVDADIQALLDGQYDIPILTESNLPQEAASEAQTQHELAYVIFTSGSTGVPKGVEIPLAALQNYTEWALQEMQITEADRMSQHPNIGFDLSVLDIYAALSGGASLHTMTELEAKLSPGVFIRRHGLTIWNSVPSVIDVMIAGKQLTRENLCGLRLMTFCGEALLLHHVERILEAHPSVLVHNTYGPTEATVSCTLQRLTASSYREFCGLSAALGDPIRNTNVRLVADNVESEAGEIVITGVQLARGYWEDEMATARAFRSWFDGEKSERAFFTNDWAKRVGSSLYFSERIDSQVKIGGHRLELEEVNSALRKLGAEFAASVLVNNVIHSFVKPRSLIEPPAALKEALMNILEPYAVPRFFHYLEDPPYNANGKVDMKALKNMVAMGGEET